MLLNADFGIIRGDIDCGKGRHSRESGNPGKDWIPGQARNDKSDKTYLGVYNSALRNLHSAI
jgi:hypothetical protein